MFELTIGNCVLVISALAGFVLVVSACMHSGGCTYEHDSTRPDYRI